VGRSEGGYPNDRFDSCARPGAPVRQGRQGAQAPFGTTTPFLHPTPPAANLASPALRCFCEGWAGGQVGYLTNRPLHRLTPGINTERCPPDSQHHAPLHSGGVI